MSIQTNTRSWLSGPYPQSHQWPQRTRPQKCPIDRLRRSSSGAQGVLIAINLWRITSKGLPGTPVLLAGTGPQATARLQAALVCCRRDPRDHIDNIAVTRMHRKRKTEPTRQTFPNIDPIIACSFALVAAAGAVRPSHRRHGCAHGCGVEVVSACASRVVLRSSTRACFGVRSMVGCRVA
jgi:hypothetical protein